MLKKIAVLTSGGDAPGMNACIRAVVRAGVSKGIEVFGVMRGYEGLIDGELKSMALRSVSNIITAGGTIIKTSRSERFLTKEGRKKAIENLDKYKIDGLIVIGGNGSFTGAHILQQEWQGMVVGVPGTIDNDLSGTDYTLGADTAVNTALGAMDKIRDTVHSMERIFVVEVMGRQDGFIAIRTGLAGGAEDILVPDNDYRIDDICEDIKKGRKKGKVSWIVVVAEGVASAEEIAKLIHENTDFEVRHVTLGHVQRGGSPTAFDRILGSRFGAAAVEALINGQKDKAIGIESDQIVLTDFTKACQHSPKKMVLDRELYRLTKLLAT
ncbi:MAG: 6-phosphofructokinase [Candidatus Omnitrophica bacterium CG12_big_fil_rev_8_21_14_0_65_43_15]|uniref:ATP-dependent 6-phosphofructokinase n=1 Tax=Candidatus Taenaricola geysiri TaxID=1974752 RepID=A0A2J0LM88_9BACT|nr:MAG: 6-phosphofructokinase [Candidatus Omnitrophica bacterium CG1_02_43_210]PIR65512.1 MAG: 6-phosphofructokinase [Candidatus Omnitrophica bacterium CG10_big_fil_rev_8_21_14_0_10_43_8]PIV12335.1 MAG: 6-phosphofructokinase [Candidatus Omnitrophica bacterium CG03_land_8_20_14_0_80_43_22]PIW66713.1 MAG: 6-phosphofructokinase [Candidatus Omnitrophica bacterium CG12_big_fil_rev_8_21_14_0_65_43_15]PIW80771.1 MAG: 6-phosphofructokinase [Candidatus Omnitrophica bacterium CG_4_8_14_3_um_filter_43_15]